MSLISRGEYDEFTAGSRERRLDWFKKARLGMFIHYGLFSQLEAGEWVQAAENISADKYAALAKTFAPKEGCADEWCAQAKRMGAKYAVLTTRHHEGFSLWDSKVNPYNSMNACGRDIVREFCDACRKYGLSIGLYSSLMDWHHPDGGSCAYDSDARRRLTDYIEALNVELLSSYGKIDILWYDMPWPMESSESWNSVQRNYRLRQLQPDIIINNRSKMPEDFSTPEEAIKADDNAYWEACMTFNRISWGYIDSDQAEQYSYRPGQIIRMLRSCAGGYGNLMLNIGPMPDGSVPKEAKATLDKIGEWLSVNGEAVYGEKKRISGWTYGGRCTSEITSSPDAQTLYFWNYIWPKDGEMRMGGYKTMPKKVTLLSDGSAIDFVREGEGFKLINLPKTSPDKILGVTVIKAEFDEPVKHSYASLYPQLHYGRDTR